MRVFIAVDIDEKVKQALAQLLSLYQERIPFLNWTTKEQWHVTLAFLGEVEQKKLNSLQKQLSQIEGKCFSCRVKGVGVFPHWEAPKVLWVGISEGEAIHELYFKLWASLKQAGFVPEGREFHPHLTLARIKRPLKREEKKLLESLSLGDWEVEIREFSLYQSVLHPGGARYTRLASYPLEELFHG